MSNQSGIYKADILVIDDTPENLQLLSTILTERGYKVRSVTKGVTGLRGAQAAPPDLILLDVNMPQMSGYEVCEQLKADDRTCKIPVIFISALGDVLDKVKAFQIGGVDYITKPFQIEEVLVRIENQLTICRLQAQLLKALEQERALNQRVEEMAALEERNRIARDIHDSLGHGLVALNIQMETALSLWQDDPDKAYTFLVHAKQLGSEALQAVRQSVTDIRADPLQGQLLEGAIATLVQEFHHTTGVLPEHTIDLSQPLPNPVTVAVYRIVQEGLTNIYKHAGATAVKIQIQITGSELFLTIQDNGKGFQVNENRTRFGLQGMRERTAALRGQLEIVSMLGMGCQITARFPRVAE